METSMAACFHGNQNNEQTQNTSTARLSQLDDHLGFWLRLVSNQVSARFQSLVYERAGCSVSEWVLLRVLYEQSATGHNELIKTLV